MKKRIDKLLYEKDLAPSRTKAQAMIMAHQVKVDGELVTKAGTRVEEDAEIEVESLPQYVSRGGDKLASVIGKFGVDFSGAVVADIGSSTGGFTDFALQNGSERVFAVDVGTKQLHQKLREDERVTVWEKTDIRDIEQFPESIDIATIDVSFVSLRQILPAVYDLVNKSTQVIALVKPQFETNKKVATQHKGVIKNNTIRRRILHEFEAWVKDYFIIEEKADSDLSGAKGNVERFYLLKKITE